MQIINYLLSILVSAVQAANVVSIQSLPAYVNTNNFKISCTSNGSSAQFSVSKHGGSYVDFGGAIDLTVNQCLVQVTSAQFDGQTDYTFRVTVDGVDSATTTTNYDISGPSPVSGYKKERINDGKYKISWRNPTDTDFDKVIIYRGDALDFSADGSHEVARVTGSPDSDMTYDDSFAPDANKTYFYDVRAIDKAGNSSSLVGDGNGSVVVVNPSSAPSSGSFGKISLLPKEKSVTGRILGTETTPTPNPEAASTVSSESGTNTAAGAGNWIMTHKKISLGVALLLAGLGYGLYSWRNKNK